MDTLPIITPFNAPVYYEKTVSSTMDVSRILAKEDAPHGTVITADFQEQGRGRTAGRLWLANAGENLFFTILLRYAGFSAIPKQITLRAGLAVSMAVEDIAGDLVKEYTGARPIGGFSAGADGIAGLSGITSPAPCVLVKWPNDVMMDGKKVAGILSESDGNQVFIGIGVNVLQTEFPESLRRKTSSIALALRQLGFGGTGTDTRFHLLERILTRLHVGLDAPDTSWQARLSDRLFLKDRDVRFIAGQADSRVVVEGRLCGIGKDGELLIMPKGKTEPLPFITGELQLD
jgi:BirA family biotin operon repressor/biotin-[acetyl-CoA-carboxylase] ligase